VPNDDRLFPGRQETQLGNGPEVKEEWAVEEILSHHGTQGDTIFEIKWKTGNITWLPSHEVSHLQALKNYLDAQGVEQINQLPPGKGNPPLDESQIVINLIEFKPNNTRLPPKKLLKYSLKFPLSPQPNPSNYIQDHYDHHLDTHIDTMTLMGKRQRSLPTITHPRFSKQGRHLIRIQDRLGNYHLTHVSHLFQCVEYSTALCTLHVDQALCRPIPVEYDFIARTWNAETTTRQFAIITSPTIHNPRGGIQAAGASISMDDFFITAEDCEMALANAADSELRALTRYVALGTIQGRERRAMEQQQRRTWRLTAFGPVKSHTWNTRRRHDSGDYNLPSDQFSTTQNKPLAGTSAAFDGPDFSSMAASLQEPYLTLDNDTTMSAPEAPSTTPVGLTTEQTASALTDVDDLQELPHFDDEELTIPEASTFDFSLLGGDKANIEAVA
jgi:hypothetical protein